MFTTDEMKWAIDLADKCIKKGLWLHAYKLCLYTSWRYEQSEWSDFGLAPDRGFCIRIRTQKTKTEATLPISYEAYELCGEEGSGKVFKGLTRSMINYPLKHWLTEAGIEKHVTFHCFRHTFATLQIAAGTDIYTVSKMLTHRNVSTTQIYAELVNEKKRESANRISLK